MSQGRSAWRSVARHIVAQRGIAWHSLAWHGMAVVCPIRSDNIRSGHVALRQVAQCFTSLCRVSTRAGFARVASYLVSASLPSSASAAMPCAACASQTGGGCVAASRARRLRTCVVYDTPHVRTVYG